MSGEKEEDVAVARAVPSFAVQESCVPASDDVPGRNEPHCPNANSYFPFSRDGQTQSRVGLYGSRAVTAPVRRDLVKTA